jgi:hypothetical protein
MSVNLKQDARGGVKPNKNLKRRAFLAYSGASLSAAALVMVGCDDNTVSKDINNAKVNANSEDVVDLGSGDVGILNYAYALEQLEAAFYTMVVADGSFASIFNEEEQMILTDLKAHEVIHRDFFKTALGTNAIRNLEVDFSSINFGSRDSVLGTAKAFEDLGVAAYNGAGKLIADVNYLLIAGKIVSVEARHAAAIRDLLNPLSADFSGDDVVVDNGLDQAMMPLDVLAIAGVYIKDTIIATNLPTM